MMAHPAMGGAKGKDVRERGQGTRAYWEADYAVRLTEDVAEALDGYRAFRDDDDEDEEAAARTAFVRDIETALTLYRLVKQHEHDTPLPSAPGHALDAIAVAARALATALDDANGVLDDVWSEAFSWPKPHGPLGPYDVRGFRQALDRLDMAVWARRTALGAPAGGRPANTAVAGLVESLARIYDRENGDDGIGRGRLAFVCACAQVVGVTLSKHVRQHLRSRKPPPTTG